MHRLLVLNPNTTAAISELLQRHVAATAGPGVAVRTHTASFGAPYIVDEASYAVAAHAALEGWRQAGDPRPDAVLVGCFGDPGLFALREVAGVPVTGLAEASFVEARRRGRFVVVTGGARWAAMLRRLAKTLDYDEALLEVHTVDATGAQLAADREAAVRQLTQACREAARVPGAQAVVLGGAGLAGLAEVIQPAVGVPLIDSVAAGARVALERVTAGRAAPSAAGPGPSGAGSPR